MGETVAGAEPLVGVEIPEAAVSAWAIRAAEAATSIVGTWAVVVVGWVEMAGADGWLTALSWATSFCRWPHGR